MLHAPSKTCVWVANRAAPITDRAAPLQLTANGISIEDPNGTTIWSTPPFETPVAALRLDDHGNLAPMHGLRLATAGLGLTTELAVKAFGRGTPRRSMSRNNASACSAADGEDEACLA